MQDEEIASQMIHLFGRKPRPNSRLRIADKARGMGREALGGLALTVVGIVLVVLLLTF